MNKPVVPTDKGRAYIEWRMQDRDRSEDDDAIVAFSAGWDARHPSVPTREQIAEALYLDDADHEDWSWATEDNTAAREAYLKNADAVLALLNGADR